LPWKQALDWGFPWTKDEHNPMKGEWGIRIDGR